MRRKIIKLGEATLVTSLPSKWAKMYGLKQGDELEIDEKENKLIIATKREFATEKAVLDITNIASLINYGIMALYLKGIDELVIKSDDPSLIGKLQERPLKELIGYEIIEQGKNHCTIKDISGSMEMDYDVLLKRVFLLINSMADEMEKAVESKSTDLGHIPSIDFNANRFAFLCLRKLNKQGYKGNVETSVYYFLILTLERIGDLYSDSADYITKNKIVLSKESIDMLKKVNLLYRKYQELFFTFNLAKASELDGEYRDLSREFDRIFAKTDNKNEIRVLVYLSNIADAVAEMLRNKLVVDIYQP